MMSPRVAGLVLAGGLSSRMGKEKAVQALGGRSMLAWTLAALDGACEAVAVNAGPASAAAALGRSLRRRVVMDDPDHVSGPLAGVAAGLTWAAAEGYDLLFTLPCDMPLVGTSQLLVIRAALMDQDAAYAATPGLAQPLCALWRVSLSVPLAATLSSGRHPRVRVYLAEIGARAVPFPDAQPFRNLNTPDDLECARAELAAAGS